MYDAFLKTLGTSSSTTLVVANAASLTNDISAINETSIAGHKPCLIHTSGKHTNDECFKQKDIRANSDMTSYKLIAALTKLYQENKVEHTRTQALKKQSQAVTLARSKSNPQKKKGANGHNQKPRSKSQDNSLPASPSKPSKRVLDDDSTAAASKGSSKSSKKRKDDTASTQKAHMACQSTDKESIDGDDEDDYDLDRALGIDQYTISAADYAVMSSTTSHVLSESTIVPNGLHSVSMAKGVKGVHTLIAKRFRKIASMEEQTPRDDLTQLDIESPANGTASQAQPTHPGSDDDTSDGSSVSTSSENKAYNQWLIDTNCVGKARKSCPTWQWPPMPDNSSEESDNEFAAIDTALNTSAADAKPCCPSTFHIPQWHDPSDLPVVNQPSKARNKPLDSAGDFDQISPDWVVKSSKVKPVVSIASYIPDSSMSAEEAEQHELEDEWERREAARDAKAKRLYGLRRPVHVFLSDEEDVKEKEDTGPAKSYRSEDDEKFPTEFQSVLGPNEPLSRSMSSMTNTSSNPSSTRPSSSSSSHQRTAPTAMRSHSDEPDSNMLDQFSASSRKRQAGITVAERAAGSMAKRQQASPTITDQILLKYNSRGERIHETKTPLQWAELYGLGARQHGMTASTRLARMRFNELLAWIQAERVLEGKRPLLCDKIPYIADADIIYAAIEEQRDDLTRDFASYRQREREASTRKHKKR